MFPCLFISFFFFFNDTATTEIYTLSLHDALPIFRPLEDVRDAGVYEHNRDRNERSEEHTSELQSQFHLVCRLLLEKKKTQTKALRTTTEQQDIPGTRAIASP